MSRLAPDRRLAATIARTSRGTVWELVDEVPLGFDAHHPQGMVRVDDLWWITTVDIDRSAGWLLVVDGSGQLLDRHPVGDDVRFHPGGLDFDGAALWVASAEYRPRSTAMVQRVDPASTPRAETAFRVDDHVGGLVRLGPSGDLVGWTWGSRRFLRWTVEGSTQLTARHASQFIDYQDGQWLGDDLVVCSGVATLAGARGPVSIGGIALLKGDDLAVVKEVPFPGYSPATGRPSTQNPIHVEIGDDALLLHLLPDDGRGSILTYATPLADPT